MKNKAKPASKPAAKSPPIPASKAKAPKAKPSPWREYDCEEDLLFLGDPGNYEFDCAIIGLAERFGGTRAIAYDTDKVIEVLIRNGMDFESAREWYEFNIIGSFLGDHTPIFICTDPM